MDDHAKATGTSLRELVTVILLSITTVLTAWTGFQASKWGGAMSIAFSEASSERIEASRQEAVANRKLTIQVSLFTQWLQASQAGDEHLADFLVGRFPEPLASSFPAWSTTSARTSQAAPASPFDMPEYVIPEAGLAQQADARAGRKFAEALRNNGHGDDYTALTIAFASVLFFGALSGRMRTPRAQWTLLGLGILGCLVASAVLLARPKIV